jgi:hypothetical protein
MKRALTLITILIVSLCRVGGQELAGSSFRAIDVFVDSGNQALAAYQLTFVGTNSVKIVGIEGGEHSAFAEPPYYDPNAMQSDRVVIGAFNTSGDLPSGRTRVATIHVQTLSGRATYKVEMNGSAAADGKQIKVRAEAEERNGK